MQIGYDTEEFEVNIQFIFFILFFFILPAVARLASFDGRAVIAVDGVLRWRKNKFYDEDDIETWKIL